VASDQPISERRWFTRLWGHGEPLGNPRYVLMLVAAPVLVVFAVLLTLHGTWQPWWGLVYLAVPLNVGGQVYRERQRRMRERATRLRNAATSQ
jgi:hypothetical protein